MTLRFDDMGIEIKVGDCLEILKEMESDSLNSCVTSPPYFGLRDYGVDGQIGLEETPELYTQKLVEVFREVRRILRPDGTLWLNLGDSYASIKGGDHGFKDGRSNRSERRNAGVPASVKVKDLIGIPWRVAFALQADGWYLRQDIIWHKPNPMPESVRDRCTKSHEYIFLLSKSPKYYYDSESVREPCSENNVADFKRRKTMDNKGKGKGTYDEARPDLTRSRDQYMPKDFKRNRRSVWTVNTKPFKGAHFATFPVELIEPCILAGCPIDGTVIDPFFGAGTTALVAQLHGRNAVGIELNNDYADIARARLGLPIPFNSCIKDLLCNN